MLRLQDSLADGAAVGTGAKGVGVDAFSSTSSRFVLASCLGLVAPPTTGALVDDAAVLSISLNR